MSATDQHLGRLEAVGLIRFAAAQPELEYLFRHALVQDAAYASMLRADRKRLHSLVGLVGEQMYADRLDEMAPLLARHFHEAGDPERALAYYRQAGDHAAQHYALREALAHYSQALTLAGPTPPPGLLRARGRIYETLGDSQQARADLEAALAAAEASGDPVAEWQALIDLGALWTGLAYSQAGVYYERAHAHAQRLADPAMLAHSLNRLGHWHLNMEDPQTARTLHQQALTLFDRLADAPGRADTLDLLGMMNYVGGHLQESRAYYEQALAQFRALDHRPGLMSVLATLAVSSANYQTSTLHTAVPPDMAIQSGLRAVALARTIGARTAEAFALNTLTLALAGVGQYEAALAAVQQALALAAAIGHRQWAVIAHYSLGGIYTDLLAFEQARPHLEQARTLALQSDSRHWIRATTAQLAMACMGQGDVATVVPLLAEVASADLPAETIGARMVWRARAELALAQGQPDRVLEIVDRRLLPLPGGTDGTDGATVPHLALLRGQALALAAHPAAESELTRAVVLATDQGTPWLAWRAHAALAHLHAAQGRAAEAAAAHAATLQVITPLAAGLSDQMLAAQFQARVAALLPPLAAAQ
jgi:tetratricopeptide (TPR) repeat protein